MRPGAGSLRELSSSIIGTGDPDIGATNLSLSAISLAIQTVGVCLIALLFLFLSQSLRLPVLRSWTAGWGWLAIALIALSAFMYAGVPRLYVEPVYHFGEYLFVYHLWAGCRASAREGTPPRGLRIVLAPAALLAAGLPFLFSDFNAAFVVHAVVLAAAFLLAWRELLPLARESRRPGVRVTALAILLLSIDFAIYVPLFVHYLRTGEDFGYLRFNGIFDLTLEMILGFGQVMLVMEGIVEERERAIEDLRAARDGLARLAREDPLTDALNRHAFHALLREGRPEPSLAAEGGCVVVADVDGLKQINDGYGHATGDLVIREVARALRSCVRGDDLVFRWGGDEFLIVLFGLREEDAERRFSSLARALRAVESGNGGPPVTPSVSVGVAEFREEAAIAQAIARADGIMYERKRAASRPAREST